MTKESGKLHWFHWLVISLSLILTLIAWYFSKQQINEKVEIQFNREAEQVTSLVTERMAKYENALWGGVAALNALDHTVDHTAWQHYSETLHIGHKYPGINGLGLINHVPPAELTTFLAQQQSQRPNFTIHPTHNNNEYWPITFIEPVAKNKKAVGLDIAHENNRLTAAKAARDTGLAHITGPITLVQDSQKTPGFLFYTPFYHTQVTPQTTQERQDTFGGLVYAPFIMHQLMEGTLQKQKRRVRLKITDNSTTLYDEHQFEEDNEDFDKTPLFKKNITIQLYGRIWNFEIWSTKSFRTANSNHQPLIILIGGLLIELLLISLFLMLSKSNQNAIRKAQQITHELQKNEEKTRLILENAGDGICGLDNEGRIVFANDTATKMLGYTTSEIVGTPQQNFIYTPTNNHTSVASQRETHGDTDEIFLKKDGTTLPVEYSRKIIEGELGNITGAVLVFRDITKRQEQQKEREHLIAKLLSSNDELERFAYVASHDLQEPLRMVRNFTLLLQKKYGDQLNAEAQKYIDISAGAAQRMQFLIEDLLEYARMTQEADKHEEVNLNKILSFIKENLEENLKHVQGEITHDELPTVYGNPIRFSRILQNLISNGLKYQKEGAQPKVQVSAEEQKDQWILSVKDNGIGMKQEYCEQIFLPFKRLHQKDEYSGTGMGLAICRKIIENQGGKIWATSELGIGTTFFFTILKNKQKDKLA